MADSQSWTIRVADWRRDEAALRDIRTAVFVAELGIPEHLEWDGQDAAAVHLIAELDDGTAVGTVRLLPTGRIGRMAVLPAWRGKAIGRGLLEALLLLARTRNITGLHLHAQLAAAPFYRRFGFRAEGPVFEEAGIAHQLMRLAVQ